jgi:Fe-S cluster assembly protein SufD
MVGLLQNVRFEGEDLPVLEGLRDKGRASFLAQQLPTPKTESWKFTRVRELTTGEFTPVQALPACTCDHHECDHHECDHHEGKCSCHEQHTLPFEAYEIHFCNGRLTDDHFHAPENVEIMSLLDAVASHESTEYLNKSFDMDLFPFAALNTAYLEQGVMIRIARNARLDKPIALIYHTDGKTRLLSNIRNLIVLEKNAQAEVIEYAYSSGAVKSEYVNNIVNEIDIAPNAALRHYKLQNEAFKAVHVTLNAVNVKADGLYESFCLQKGAQLARNETHVSLSGRHASALVNAAYMMNGWATLDTTTDIEHKVAETTSNQLIKGVVGGQAKGVFQGKIHIAPNAVKTEGYQLHKALLLTDTAEVDVKPELEIYADDVKCSHGAASGDLDEEQLFYLRSRGIAKDAAKQLLIEAFVNEVIDTVADPAVKEWIKAL